MKNWLNEVYKKQEGSDEKMFYTNENEIYEPMYDHLLNKVLVLCGYKTACI